MLLAMHEAGDIVGGTYRVVEKLREDASGTLYLAKADDKDVVLKELDTAKLREDDGNPKELFEREAAVWKDLFHPGIPNAVAALEDGGRFYLVQTHDTGRPVGDLVADGWKPEEPEILRIAREALAALAYLHTRKPAVVHAEITPDTLVHEEDGRVRLVGFPMVQSGLTEVVARRTSIGPAADLLALGHTLVFLVARKSGRVDVAKLPVSPAFRAWLKKMTDTSAATRFAKVEDAQAALAEVKSKKPAGKTQGGGLFMIIAAMLVIGGTFLYLRQRKLLEESGEPERPDLSALYALAASADAARAPEPPPKPKPKVQPLAIQPIVRWAFDTSCATTAMPSQGQMNVEARAKGPISCTEYGAAFEADAGFFEVADAPMFHPKDALSVAAWVAPETTEPPQTIVAKWKDKDAFSLYVNGGRYGFSIATTDGVAHDVFAPASDDTLSLVVGVYDGSEARIYVDGKRIAHVAAPGKIQESSRPIMIGSHPSSGALAGILTDVRLYGVALDDAQVATLYAERL
jgi:hypothetical protein